MKSHGICSPAKSSYDKTILLTIYVIGMFVSDSLVKSYPSWDLPTTITEFGRNIRQLPCVSRRTGETGVCMFAYSCAKVNGTHLGTCIDRFYFGSCCKTQADLDVGEPDNYLNSLDNEVAGRPQQTTSGAKIGSSTPSSSSSSTDRYSGPSATTAAFQSSYKPTAQFAVHSTPSSTASTTTTSTSTSRTQYTEVTVATGTKQPAPPAFASTSPSSVSSTYTTTVAQSTRPAVTTTFSTAKPSVLKPSPSPSAPYKPPSSYKPTTAAAPTKNKPQTSAKPTVQFSVPAGTTAANVPHSTVGGQDTSKPTSTYTTVTSMRPLNSSSVTATFSTLKPVVRPSSTTYKSTSASLPPQQSVTAATSAQKVKPQQTIRPATSKPKPPPSSSPSTAASSHAPPASTSFTTGRPADYGSPSTVTQPATAGSTYATRSTAENVTESIAAHLTAATAAAAMSSHHTPAYGSSSPATPVTSTSPSLVTWTTLDKVPAMPSESTKPPPSLSSYRPSGADGGSTTPSWVKLPVYETHEPSTASGSPPRETSTNAYSSSTVASASSSSSSSKPTTTDDNGPSPSDNDIFTTLNGFGTNTPSTVFPASTLSSVLTSILTPSWSSPPPPSLTTGAPTTGAPTTGAPTTGGGASAITMTDSNEAADAPLNMSNYKDVCGRRLFPSARIVGGEKVAFGKWPWQISLRQWRTSTYLHKCGAALFNENWAVTAAHCVENVPPSDLLLRLGEHDLSDEEEPYGYEERRIQIVASHPQFDPRTFEYDLALLRFYEPVKFQPNIIPVCVPDDDSSFVGSSAYVTGWGRLYEDGPLPSVLQEVTVPVINNSVCETMYRSAGYIEHIPNIFICAGWKKGGFDSCEGDSGGPMVIQRPDKRWMLAGIISWGIGCAEPNQPGVYTRISKFKDWINQILQF